MSRSPIIITDDNQSLVVIEQELSEALNKDPKDYQPLKAEHLMGGKSFSPTDSGVAANIDTILPRKLRVRAVGAAMFKALRDGDAIMLYDIYLAGEMSHGRSFVKMMQETARPDSLAAGLTFLELEQAWEIFRYNTKALAERGRLRKRKDSTI